MPKILRQEFNNDQAREFVNDIQYQRNSYYYFIGGITPWNGVGGSFSGDQAPTEIPIDSLEKNRESRSEMVFIRKITPNDITQVTRRIDWSPDTVYEQWDHTKNMKSLDFFVITDENRVYKCLDNNVDSPSTEKPQFRNIEPLKLPDGYIWKYMYTTTPFKMKRFQSPEYIPVQRSMSDNFYNNGSVHTVSVINQGNNYTSSSQTTLTVAGDTTGTGAAGSVVVNGTGGIQDFTITNAGTGYTHGAIIEVADGWGAILEPIFNISGELIDVIVLSSGYGYTNDSVVSISVGGGILHPVVSRIDGSVTDVKIINPGVGYTGNMVVTIHSVLGVGSGIYGNATAVFDVVIYDGKIKHINIIDPGQDYIVDTDTTISVNGNGEDASYFPVVYDGRIIDVVTENPGRNYTDIILTVHSASGLGSGADLRGIITQNDFESDQSVIEQTPSMGIYSVKITSPGSNYSSESYVVIEGNGTGCEAVPVIELGHITKINITAFGNGYTWAEVRIVDPLREDSIIPPAEKFSGYAILPVCGGHGSDAPCELFSSTASITTPLRNDKEMESILQDYRIFGIIKNPLDLFEKNRYVPQSNLCVYTANFNTTSLLQLDEILVLNNNKFKVLQKNGNLVYLIPLDDMMEQPTGTMISELSGNEYVSSTVTIPDFDKYSGKLIYISLEDPFTFSDEQSISIKTFITF